MSLFVKLCGIRTEAELEAAVGAGADAVGFVLTPSPRQITLEQAARLKVLLPEDVLGVAVFHEPSPDLLRRTGEVLAPDLFQSELSTLADLAPDRVLPVVVAGDNVERDLDDAMAMTIRGMVMVDSAARGGTGHAPDWERLSAVVTTAKVILAGGLTPENVEEAARTVRPFGVDVSSGIERAPGEKDPDLMRRFVVAARREPPQFLPPKGEVPAQPGRGDLFGISPEPPPALRPTSPNVASLLGEETDGGIT